MTRDGILPSLGNALQRFWRSSKGIGAVEFALAAPFMILLYIGSYQLMDAISAYRKVTITARTLADLTTQNEQITPVEADAILDGARQVMTPYSTAGATLIIAQIQVNSSGNPSIIWSRSNDQSVVTPADINLPKDIAVPNSYLIFSQIVFHYQPKVGSRLIGPLTFSDHIFMNPRQSESICLNQGAPNAPDCIGQGSAG